MTPHLPPRHPPPPPQPLHRSHSHQPHRSLPPYPLSPTHTTRSHSMLTPTTPSSHRRSRLSLAIPLSRHYQLNNQVLHLFNESYRRNLYAIALTSGRQFVETALFEIPKHGYYDSPRHLEEKRQMELECLRVSDLLGLMLEREGGVCGEEKREMMRLGKMMRERSDEETLKRYEENKEEMLLKVKTKKKKTEREVEWVENVEETSGGLCGNICMEDWYERICFRGVVVEEPKAKMRREEQEEKEETLDVVREEEKAMVRDEVPELPEEEKEPENRYRQLMQLEEETQPEEKIDPKTGEPALPPPCSLYPRVESFQFQSSPSSNDAHLPISTLAECYMEDFQHLQNRGKIAVYYLNTYQGKNPDSINGCTVIAPLLAIHHFFHGNDPLDMIPDSVIEEVIDVQAPTILPEVRKNLGLREDALIIPSDVHDYLMNQALLTQDQFVGCVGGNILSENHLGGFLKIMVEEFQGRKIAATMFFHEHVICILRWRRLDGEIWYDFIDSLPCQKGEYGALDMSREGIGQLSAVRIRCKNLESLETVIRWYSCMKFTDENREYIDTYVWDDQNTDFDPRVFQAFVWAEA